MNSVLGMAYLPNIWWMSVLINQSGIIDIHEHYVKQTYKNRCELLSANGIIALTIPIKNNHHKTPMHLLTPDDSVNWQRQHWQTIKACYGSAPFYIHYAPYIEPVFERPVEYVYEFELKLITLLLNLFKCQQTLKLSDSYIAHYDDFTTDYRSIINPKIKSEKKFKPYYQVFEHKYGFTPNLSALDLLFNCGPTALSYLQFNN